MQFITGKKYMARFISDADSTIEIKVVSRTEKTIKAEVDGKVKTLRPYVYEGVECVRPLGNYSMAPVVRADRFAF